MHTKNGGNILQVALTKDHRELAKAIIIEHNIIMSKNPDLAKRNNLTEAQNVLGETSLLYCAKTKKIDILELLLESNPVQAQLVINIPDKNNMTPIAHACHQKGDDAAFNTLLKY